MKRQAAKRLACRHAAEILDNVNDVWDGPPGWDGWPEPDRERYERAIRELVDELIRRGGDDAGSA